MSARRVNPSSGQGAIPATAWNDLKIGFDADGVPFVQRVVQRTRDPTYDNIRFSRAEALDVFKPIKTPEELNLRRQLRTRRANEFNRKQNCIALGKRRWLRLTEIANEYARKRGSLAIDSEERERALEVLRCSILTGEFVDKQRRSRVLNMHLSPLADFRLELLGASNPEQFNPIAEHLWITRQDCVDWFNRRDVNLPVGLRREPSSALPSEAEAPDPAGHGHVASEAERALAVSPGGETVRIQVPPYTIPREVADNSAQMRLARWVAWQTWGDDNSSVTTVEIPHKPNTEIARSLSTKLRELYKKNQLPLDLRGHVKSQAINVTAVRRLLGKRKD